jgi:hypothetical protein
MGERDAMRKPKALMIRYPAAAALAATALLLAACSAGSGAAQPRTGAGAGAGRVTTAPAAKHAAQPLALGVAQEGAKACAEAPDLEGGRSTGITAWNSPVGYALDWYYNVSTAPVDLESVSLIDAHGLVLHGVIVYEMRHSEHPLIQGDGWRVLSHYADPAAWAHRQRVPGAVIPPRTSTIGTPGPNARDEYEVALDVTATTSAGGYAIGQQVKYRQGNRQYTIRSYNGYAIAPPGPHGPDCQSQENAIAAAWPST